ncbi:rhamnan synthesis F family protein [Phaeobacter sp. PT47_59]|nr:rhamnan synthesis F family protein [Phaeobacter sp. PT47_59]
MSGIEKAAAWRLASHLDVPFYREQIEVARACGVDAALGHEEDACVHFLTTGWRLGLSPNRWFDMLGYLAANPEVAAMGINPFLHYLEVGLEEDRRPMPFFQDRSWTHPDLERYGRCEYGPVRHVLTFADQGQPPAERLPERLAVHLHLFYPDMLAQMAVLLARLPCAFDLLVSVPEGADLAGLAQRLRTALPQARQVILQEGPNRGRDVAPWLVSFREEIRRSDLFLHLHTKKSPHGSYHAGWGDFLGHSLLGSPAVAAQMLDLFAADAGLGLVAPAYWPMLRRAPNYGDSRDLCAHLAARMGLAPLPERCPDFPAGSFFCCRSSLLAPLLDLGLSFSDFPAEAGQICGTLAHAVERLMGILPLQAGLRFDMVAVDLPFEQAGQQPRRLTVTPEQGPGQGAGVSVICTVADPGTGPQVMGALEAVFAQSAPPQEVLLVEASGEDGILAAARARFPEQMARGQLRLLALAGANPAAARNAALEEAQGDIITYLEPGALWRKDHLARIIAGFKADPAAQSLYCGLVRSARQAGFAARSAVVAPQYGRADLLAAPLIDLAAFAHRRDLLDAQRLRFDAELGEGAVWDFILRACAQRAPVQLDHIGLARRAGDMQGPDLARPTPLPAQARQAVQRRHRNERLYWRQDRPQIALKVPAPKPEFKHRWGDLHLATSLARALERLGCRARVDILPDWQAHHPEDDATLVFRGVTPYEPHPEQINMMWHISHPTRVSLEEMRGYDHVFVSAYPRAAEVIAPLGMQASVMLQCADPEVFHPQVDLTDVPRHDLLFIGNSRKTTRWMPQACIDRDLPVAVYGAEWEGLIPPQYVKGTHVPNARLAAYYRAARIVLNDHWPDMAAQGFVSNRIMDAGLAGALVVSDRFAGEELFMGHVVTCASPAEVEEAARHYLADEQARRDKAEDLRRMVLLHHTVDLRAAQVLQTLEGLMRDRMLRLR